MASKGVFITFEGGEGVGKSTQISLLASRLNSLGHTVTLVREPGGTGIGEAIRAILLDPANTELDAMAELFLYEAARAQIVHEVIKPALERGEVVLCDRFFDSTIAYQGYGRGLDLEAIHALNRTAVGTCIPDRTILLELDASIGLSRATRTSVDRLESESLEFHQAVHDGFLAIAASDSERVRIVHACKQRTKTASDVRAALEGLGLFDGDLCETGSRP